MQFLLAAYVADGGKDAVVNAALARLEKRSSKPLVNVVLLPQCSLTRVASVLVLVESLGTSISPTLVADVRRATREFFCGLWSSSTVV